MGSLAAAQMPPNRQRMSVQSSFSDGYSSPRRFRLSPVQDLPRVPHPPSHEQRSSQKHLTPLTNPQHRSIQFRFRKPTPEILCGPSISTTPSVNPLSTSGDSQSEVASMPSECASPQHMPTPMTLFMDGGLELSGRLRSSHGISIACRHRALPHRSLQLHTPLIPARHSSSTTRDQIIHRYSLLLHQDLPAAYFSQVVACAAGPACNVLPSHSDLAADTGRTVAAITEQAPGSVAQFVETFQDDRYCVFTVADFLHSLMHICAWLEDHGLYLHNFSMDSFSIRADGRLVLNDLASVFPVRRGSTGELNRTHKRPALRSTSDVFSLSDVSKQPYQAPEVAYPASELRHGLVASAEIDYTKAHTWSCAAMILHYLTSSPLELPEGAALEASAQAVQAHLARAEFITQTGDARTDGQGRGVLAMLEWMLDVNPSKRPTTDEALSGMAGLHKPRQAAVDFAAKYNSWK